MTCSVFMNEILHFPKYERSPYGRFKGSDQMLILRWIWCLIFAQHSLVFSDKRRPKWPPGSWKLWFAFVFFPYDASHNSGAAAIKTLPARCSKDISATGFYLLHRSGCQNAMQKRRPRIGAWKGKWRLSVAAELSDSNMRWTRIWSQELVAQPALYMPVSLQRGRSTGT